MMPRTLRVGGVTIKSYHREYTLKIQRAESRALKAAGERLRQLVQKELNTSAGPTTVRVKRQTPGGNKTSRTVHRNPSKPGQAPHLRTGNLRRNIFHDHQPTRRVSRVGWRRNAIYGLFHELGIQYSRAGFQKRPHLMSTFRKNKASINRLFTRIMKRAMS